MPAYSKTVLKRNRFTGERIITTASIGKYRPHMDAKQRAKAAKRAGYTPPEPTRVLAFPLVGRQVVKGSLT